VEAITALKHELEQNQ